jgi:hypothetical protein
MNIEKLEDFGWKSDEMAAYVSLKSAIQSYFDTYRALSFVKPMVDFSTVRTASQFEILEYKSDYFTCITHFQHFFELILKDTLERIDPLLSKKMDEKGIVDIYCKLNGTSNPNSEKIQSIEFGDALKRLQKIREVNPNDVIINEIDFLLNNNKALEKWNHLRNRIWHKGLFFLNYHALDWFVGHEILPLVKQVFEMTTYSGKMNLWHYKSLSCGLDPIELIIQELEGKEEQDIDYEKVALLKEMGRASYQNPLEMVDVSTGTGKWGGLYKSLAHMANEDKINESLAKTEAVIKQFYYCDAYTCPICGQKTFVRFVNDEGDGWEDENDEYHQYEKLVPYKVECQTCSFKVNPNIKNLSMISLDGNEIWKTDEWSD